MRVVSRKALRELWEAHPNAQQPLEDWYWITKHAQWANLAETRFDFPLRSEILRECRIEHHPDQAKLFEKEEQKPD